MFGSWFSKPHGRKETDDAPHQGLLDSSTHSTGTLDVPHQQLHDEPGAGISAGYFSPHDAILAHLGERSGDSPSRSHTIGSRRGTVESPDAAPDPPHARRQPRKRSTSARVSAPEPIYDPFTGNLLGTLHSKHAPAPGAGSSGSGPDDGIHHRHQQQEHGPTPTSSGDDTSAAFDAARDELWGHLGRIRTLQSEIATLHVQMEGAGLGERKGPGASRRMSSTVGPVSGPRTSVSGSGAEWEDEEDEEAEARREREGEFVRLAGRFERRQDAVDGVMSKLDDLAKALTSFHALQTPVNTFPRSRSNTEDTSASLGSGGYGSSNMMSPSSFHGPGHSSSPSRFSAPGPRFDSSPAMAPRMLLSPDLLGSPSRSYVPLTASPVRHPAPLIVEEAHGFDV